jgi:hypothetical protein
MDSFTATGSLGSSLLATTDQLSAPVPNGVTVHWSVSFPAGADYNWPNVAVYPIEMQAVSSANTLLATAHTLLPWWPSKTAAVPLKVAWIWPLVDTPQQGACKDTLASSELSGSVASGGRLSALLGAGAAWAQRDQLTWSIDPALLSDVSVMTRGHFTGGNGDCTGRFQATASTAAASWLTSLRSATAGQPAFLTSYANVDVAALSHDGLSASIRSAYQVGRMVAGQILPNTFGKTGEGTGDGTVLRAAWPADGLADRGVLASLVSEAGTRTLVLASGQARSSTGNFDNALSRTTSGGTPVSLLLADSQISTLLGTASPSDTARSQFALTQNFLAQTAMISSEAPNLARSLVVAPPSSWNPSAAEASALLTATHQAPWLRSVDLSKLARDAARVPSVPLKRSQVSKNELTDSYLDQVRAIGASASLFKNLLYQPSADLTNRLAAAVAATASSAWRGEGATGGEQALTYLFSYLSDSVNKVKIIASKKIVLAGTTGETPVSVLNGLPWPVQVQVVAAVPPGSHLQVGRSEPAILTVPAHRTNTARLPLHSDTIGTTTVQLQLVTQNGSPLTTAVPLSVEVTRFGRSLLIIIGAALGILVLTSAYRLRRKRNGGGGHDGSPKETANAGGAG